MVINKTMPESESDSQAAEIIKCNFLSTQDRSDRKCYGYVFSFGMKTSELMVNVMLLQKKHSLWSP